LLDGVATVAWLAADETDERTGALLPAFPVRLTSIAEPCH